MLANVGFGISIFNESFNISLSMPYTVKQYHYDSYARDNTGFEASSIDLTYLSANATIELNSKINIRPYILVKSSSYIDTQTDVSIIAETKNLDFREGFFSLFPHHFPLLLTFFPFFLGYFPPFPKRCFFHPVFLPHDKKIHKAGTIKT